MSLVVVGVRKDEGMQMQMPADIVVEQTRSVPNT